MYDRICVAWQLDPREQEWKEDGQIFHEKGGTSPLSGTFPDQAALFGALLKLRELA